MTTRSVLLFSVIAVVQAGPAVNAAAQTMAANPPARSRFAPNWPDDTTPVKVNVPREYDTMMSFMPSADKPSSGTFFVDFPGMRPWPFGYNRCKSLCEGQIAVEISTGTGSEVNHAAWAFSRELSTDPQQAEQGKEPRYAITTLAPLPGYTQAWLKVDRQPSDILGLPIETRLYLDTAPNGTPHEFVECATLMPRFHGEPYCHVHTTLDGNPAVHISLLYHLRHWPERDAIRAAVMRLVQSWL